LQKKPPSRLAFDKAVATNQANGHENEGPLSAAGGFLPNPPPLLSLPAEYRAWDDFAARLPELFSSLHLRREADQLPVLGAGPDQLPDKYLLRASSLMSILAHSYQRVEINPPEQLPASIIQPWEEISARLGKPHPFLSYLELIMYNWKLRDPKGPPVLENIDLLFPTVGTEEERVFYLTQIDIAYQFAPLVSAIIRAQEAALNDDPAALERELLMLLQGLQYIAHVTFQKIDPNPYARTFVDQVVWAKTVAPFAVPINPATPGPSGTAAPIFHLMDAFFSRKDFDSVLGHEAHKLGQFSPPAWQNFVNAVGETSVLDYIHRYDYRSLRGLFYHVMEAYAGDKGYLGVHRLKVYGFLENAFKAGRSVTIGGFKGLFRNKTWNQIDRELQLTRDERYNILAHHSYTARLAQGTTYTDPQNGSEINFITLDLANTGLRYWPGDRAGVFPENSEDLIEKTLKALQATGDEKVELNRAWRIALQRLGQSYAPVQPLRNIIKYGMIRPVTRAIARQLYSLTASGFLRQVLNERAEDQWELWDLLESVSRGGYDVKRFWKAGPGEAESICRVIPPEAFRLYSIASSPTNKPGDFSERLSLIVGGLKYQTFDSPVTRAEQRFGTGSHFLEQVIEAESKQRTIPLKVISAARFGLPANPNCPIVMFAAGSGVAPFSGFLQARASQPGKNWLYFATRTPSQVFYQPEFETLVKAGKLDLRVAFSASDHRLNFDGEKLVLVDGQRAHVEDIMLEEENARALWDLLRSRREGGQEANFYICGQTSFARKVMDTLRQIIAQFEPDKEAASRRFYKLVADRRYMQDIFTTYSPTFRNKNLYNASQVVEHNNPTNGYWAIVNSKVYDLTEFIHLHPGGMKIIANNVGIDATAAYEAVLHHVNSEVDAMLGMYELGVLRRIDFGQKWCVGVNSAGLFYFSLEEAFTEWVRTLYLVTEMQNSIENDYSFLDKKMTVADRPGTITPFKLQYLIEVHQRIFTNFLDGLLDEELLKVWQYGLGIYEDSLKIDSLPNEFKTVRQEASYQKAGQTSPFMQQLLRSDQRAFLIEMSEKIMAEDRRLFEELKAALRSGVIVFETCGSESATKGRADLFDSLNRVPGIVRGYYKRLVAVVEQVEAVFPMDPAEATAVPRPEEPAFQGHGSALRELTPAQGGE
jgi:sulfite reductase alpha subunit-like flavoprotein